MVLSLALAVVVMVVGLVLYLVAAGKPQDIGRIMFAAGLLVVLLRAAGWATLRLD